MPLNWLSVDVITSFRLLLFQLAEFWDKEASFFITEITGAGGGEMM